MAPGEDVYGRLKGVRTPVAKQAIHGSGRDHCRAASPETIVAREQIANNWPRSNKTMRRWTDSWNGEACRIRGYPHSQVL
jgi:hypothetical protein